MPGRPVGWPGPPWEWVGTAPRLPRQTALWQDGGAKQPHREGSQGLPSVGTLTGQYMRRSKHRPMQSLGSHAGGTPEGQVGQGATKVLQAAHRVS